MRLTRRWLRKEQFNALQPPPCSQGAEVLFTPVIDLFTPPCSQGADGPTWFEARPQALSRSATAPGWPSISATTTSKPNTKRPVSASATAGASHPITPAPGAELAAFTPAVSFFIPAPPADPPLLLPALKIALERLFAVGTPSTDRLDWCVYVNRNRYNVHV